MLCHPWLIAVIYYLHFIMPLSWTLASLGHSAGVGGVRGAVDFLMIESFSQHVGGLSKSHWSQTN